MKRVIFLILLLATLLQGGVTIIPLDSTQTNIREAYRYAFWRSKDLWIRNGDVDSTLSNQFGEIPILLSGHYDGFVYPDTLSLSRPFRTDYDASFNTSTLGNSWCLRWISNPGIAIYQSSVLDNYNQTSSWEFSYFEEFFRNILAFGWGSEVVGIVDSMIPTMSTNVKLLIIPAFEVGDSVSAYMDATLLRYPTLGDNLRNFLSRGGTILTEGNSAYLLQVYGILPVGSVDLTNTIDGVGDSMYARVQVTDNINPLGMIGTDAIYTVSAPTFAGTLHSIAHYTLTANPLDNGKPAIVYLEGADALGGRIILCGGLPAVESLTHSNGCGWQWLANAVVTAFAERIAVGRFIYTGTALASDIAPMALPADAEQTFEITIRIRNLWNRQMTNVTVEENVKAYFDYVDTPEGPTPTISGTRLTYNIPTINANDEYKIVYRLKTPPITDPRVSNINSYLDSDVYMRPSTNWTSFDDPQTSDRRGNGRWHLWSMFLFNARIVADTDLNWKNILGNYFQPFKIFMIMENKERTSALETRYVQYVPLDIPVLWVDPTAVTPIVRTPGGTFVDLFRGSQDLNMNGILDPGELEYDMNGDGNPDAWINWKSFHPMPDSIELQQIYWLNPWSDEYEDIDRDGIRPVDSNGDGVFEVEDPGDLIRAYRCVWNMNTIPGYQWYDPKCSWEIWLDPPDLVQMSIGAPDTLGYDGPEGGFYYPGFWKWMNNDGSGNITFRRLIHQTIDSYTGYAFVDSSYVLRGGDTDMGWVPYPREEYICVLNFGGKDPTMTSPTPDTSLYANIYYKTVWGQEKVTPIRTSYTYYAPLPNPMQFEYVSTTYEARDPGSGRLLTYFPGNADANISFHITASTEYSKYWIKLAGRDVDGDGFGDGVFGYIIHNIPKGFGGYAIELAHNPDGTFNTSSIVPDYSPVDLIDTTLRRDVEIWEYPFYYSVYIPQVLMPPALDDDNHDGVDDWDDDFGDRFNSETGYLHDAFPPGTGEESEALYGVGWWEGPDSTIGDDDIEKLGSVKFTVNAKFRGRGKEGEVKINDGTWLVCEEIFGGSPWVMWSHVQSGYAIANNIRISGGTEPSLVSMHPDTTLVKFHIWDEGEPHNFDEYCDPWLVTIGQVDAAFTTHAGGKDPCTLLQPDYLSRARIDPISDTMTVTAIPWAIGDSILLASGYPKTGSGAFLQVIIEVNNNTDEHWYNVRIHPNISGLGLTEPFLWYAVYPRPLVPGDDPRTFRAGWRFNPSAREVLMRIGDTDGSAVIPEVLASRRAYYIFTFKIDPGLAQGVYEIPFQISGRARRYDTTIDHPIDGYIIPPAKFSIVRRDASGNVTANQRFIIGTAQFGQLTDNFRNYATMLSPDVRWSQPEPHYPDFATYTPTSFSYHDSTLTVNMPYSVFPPDPNNMSFWISSLFETEPKISGTGIPLDYGANVTYSDFQDIPRNAGMGPVTVNARGSFLRASKKVAEVNGTLVGRDGYYILEQGDNRMKIGLILRNIGNDLATSPALSAKLADDITLIGADTIYAYILDSLTNTVNWNRVADLLPGERRMTWVEVGVPRVEGRDNVDIMYTFTADYNPEHYKAFDYDTIRYALDLVLTSDDIRISNSLPNRGEVVDIIAKVHHSGVAEAKNVHLRAWLENRTGQLEQIGDDIVIPRLNALDDTTYIGNFPITVTTDPKIFFERVFVMVDPDSSIGESSEHNNIGAALISFQKGNPLHNIVNYPNPFKDRTDFTYNLAYPVDEVKIKVYTLSGKFIKEFPYAPTNAGYNYVSWDGRDDDGDAIGNGTYIYRIIARVSDKGYEVKERAVRMR